MIVRDCTFKDTDAGIRMKAGRGAGGLVEDVIYENLTMDNVKVPDLHHQLLPDDPVQSGGRSCRAGRRRRRRSGETSASAT